jgi:hypothetical protein
VLLDYGLDAERAGIDRVVFVIRPEMAETFPAGLRRDSGGACAARSSAG